MERKTRRKDKKVHPRQLQGLSMRQNIQIFCEGATEVGYFSSFKKKTKAIPGGNALKIVTEAILRKDRDIRPADQYWIVFDKDDTPTAEFDRAVKLAQANGFQIAWSNQAFELWLILHFREVSHACHRKKYEEMLRRYLPEYTVSDKGEEQGKELFARTWASVKNAIENAKKGHLSFDARTAPSEMESCTLVYQLIEVLLKELQ